MAKRLRAEATASEHLADGNPETAKSDDKGRARLSITLSQKSASAFAWLKDVTDADTDSEVIRNALRLHYALLKKHAEGASLLIKEKDGQEPVAVDLFVTV